MKNNIQLTFKLFLKAVFTLVAVFMLGGCKNDKFNSGAENQQQDIQAVPIKGLCGAKNDSCTTGTFLDVVDTEVQFLWTCKGANGGADIACSNNKPVNGWCGALNNTCMTGNFTDVTDSEKEFIWSCKGA